MELTDPIVKEFEQFLAEHGVYREYMLNVSYGAGSPGGFKKLIAPRDIPITQARDLVRDAFVWIKTKQKGELWLRIHHAWERFLYQNI